MLERIKFRLLGYAKVRINGVDITIKKLMPSDFLDSENLYPFSHVVPVEEKLSGARESQENIVKFKTQVRSIIQHAVISPNISSFIDEFMDTEVYIHLFTAIHLHAFGKLKKKTIRQFRLTKELRLLYTQ